MVQQHQHITSAMRERRTFILPGDSGLGLSDIIVDDAQFTFTRASEAALERRITAGLRELPQQLSSFLKQFHEIHIRFSSSRNDDEVNVSKAWSPVLSRLPAGLHAFFTPIRPDSDTSLCQNLKHFIGSDVKCSDASTSFSKPAILSERFASSSTYQFYHPLFNQSGPIETLRAALCSELQIQSAVTALCDVLAAAFTAAHVDLDFDTISNSVTVTAFWTPSTGDSLDSRTDVAVQPQAGDKLEIGVLQREKVEDVEELALGGYLHVVGESDRPNGVQFSFPARHHPDLHDAHFSASFQAPSGLHPKFQLSFSSATLRPPRDSCALHAYWTLPSTLFIDRYQLSDPLFLSSQNLVALHGLHGEQDLEAPEWAVSGWGSAALLELAHPISTDGAESNWTVTIPTHLRYIAEMLPSDQLSSVTSPWPVVFWACDAEEGTKMNTNPFDRVNLGYDGLFGPRTMFYHVLPKSGQTTTNTITVPTLKSDQIAWVPAGTALAVLLGFAWICIRLVGGTMKANRGKVLEKKTQ